MQVKERFLDETWMQFRSYLFMQDKHSSAHFSDYTEIIENKMHLLTFVSWIEHPELHQCSPEHRATTVWLCWAHSCFLQLTRLRQHRRWQAVSHAWPIVQQSQQQIYHTAWHNTAMQCRFLLGHRIWSYSYENVRAPMRKGKYALRQLTQLQGVFGTLKMNQLFTQNSKLLYGPKKK